MPIYRFYRLRWTDAWYELSEREQQELVRQVSAAREGVGGHSIIDCESGWATESWHFFGVEEYPSVESIRAYHRRLDELEWPQYVESESMLGACLDNRAGAWLGVR